MEMCAIFRGGSKLWGMVAAEIEFIGAHRNKEVAKAATP
jgi:hypothetical protein